MGITMRRWNVILLISIGLVVVYLIPTPKQQISKYEKNTRQRVNEAITTFRDLLRNEMFGGNAGNDIDKATYSQNQEDTKNKDIAIGHWLETNGEVKNPDKADVTGATITTVKIPTSLSTTTAVLTTMQQPITKTTQLVQTTLLDTSTAVKLNSTTLLTSTPALPTTTAQVATTTMKPKSGYITVELNQVSENRNNEELLKYVPNIRVDAVNCARIVEGDPLEIQKAEKYQETHAKGNNNTEEYYMDVTKDCVKFKSKHQYVQEPLSTEEAEFPIAYSIMMFKELELAERLLRAIYHPQNYYCLHVDKKSPEAMHKAVHAMAGCFDNVFILPKATDVQWGHFNLLEPDLECMEELFKRYSKWRYFINLTGQEFPLKTNLGLVKILKTFNGANSMEGTIKGRNVERTEWVHIDYQRTDKKKLPPPKGIRLTKGAVHITVSRAFVDYMLNNKTAQEFREWVKDTAHPDETFFTSLNHSPELNVPGSYKGEPETHASKYPFITRFKNWGTDPFNYPCSGMRVRMICIFAVGDVVTLAHRPELFANKFHLDYHPLALDCMEELHYNRTRETLQGTLSFDTTYYKTLDFVKNHF